MTIISFYKIFSLCKIPKYHLIFWYVNFVEKHSIFPQNFHTRKLGEISVFYAVFSKYFSSGNVH